MIYYEVVYKKNAFLKRFPACEAPANYASLRGEAS